MKKGSMKSELKRMKTIAEGHSDSDFDEDDLHHIFRKLKSVAKANEVIIKKEAHALGDVDVDELKSALGNYMHMELGTEELVELIIGPYDY